MPPTVPISDCAVRRSQAGAPEAIQVADRWHLWHNLAERVEKAVACHRSCLIEPEPELPADRVPEPDLQQVATEAAAARIEESALVQGTRRRYEEVQALLAQGNGIKPIMRELGLAKDPRRHDPLSVTLHHPVMIEYIFEFRQTLSLPSST